MTDTVEYCNWTFWECITKYQKWAVGRDCDNNGDSGVSDDVNMITITRDSPRQNWQAYKASLEPTYVGQPPRDTSKCPKCGKFVNGVNPYDDGETWRK